MHPNTLLLLLSKSWKVKSYIENFATTWAKTNVRCGQLFGSKSNGGKKIGNFCLWQKNGMPPFTRVDKKTY
jgi:hypothetical protein